MYTNMAVTKPSLALIRCTGVGPRERELRHTLMQHFGKHVLFLVDDLNVRVGPGQPLPTDPCLYIDHAALAMLGLPYLPGLGWLCGDIGLYLAEAHFGSRYRHYWLIENDLVFTFDDIRDFFGMFDHCDEDLIAPLFGPRPDHWHWSRAAKRYFGNEPVLGMLFGLVRLTQPAISHLRPLRQLMLKSYATMKPWDQINDEAFVSGVLARDGFGCADMTALVPPLVFARDTFHTRFPFMPDETRHPDLCRRVIHPVHGSDTAPQRIAKIRAKYPEIYVHRRTEIIAKWGEAVWRKWAGVEAD